MKTKREHDAWLRVMQDAGWSYGETYDEAAKKHPEMVPYETYLAAFDDSRGTLVAAAASAEPVVDVEVVDEPVPEQVVEAETVVEPEKKGVFGRLFGGGNG